MAHILAAMMPEFLSTPSARRATNSRYTHKKGRRISIHALREEGDRRHTLVHSVVKYFYPRPPRGGRPSPGGCFCINDAISIHALREEGDAGPDLTRTRGV